MGEYNYKQKVLYIRSNWFKTQTMCRKLKITKTWIEITHISFIIRFLELATNFFRTFFSNFTEFSLKEKQKQIENVQSLQILC